MRSSGIVVGIGLLLYTVLVGWCYFVRPALFPRSGTWDGNTYWINGRSCGDISDYTSQGEGFAAYSSPEIWVGVGGYTHYQTRDLAVADVEDSCK